MSTFYEVMSTFATIFIVTTGFLFFMAGFWLVMRERD